nr:retrovirus-related Pol polyprotein from transposon TNT 1-94 [Tanacetum cinerariifolium]
MDININALYNILKQNQGDVNDALGYKKKAVVVTSDLLALAAEKTKAFNRRKFYSKPTNNNLRTSSTSQSTNKKQEFVKLDDKKVEKKDDEKKRDMSKVKCYNCKKEGHFDKDCKKAKIKDYNYYKTNMLAKKDNDEQVLLAEDQAWMESSSDSDQEINANMVFMAQIEKVLQDQLKVKHVVIDTHTECQAQYAKLEEERYEYMIRYSALCDNDEQHRKKIDEQEILFDKMSRQLVEMSNNVLRLQEEILERKRKSQSWKDVSLKPYVPNVILENIIIDLEDEIVSLLKKEKANLKTIESLKSKGFESSENAISESENQSENDCQVVEKECDQVENSKVIAPRMFKLSVSQSVSPISMSKTSCASKNGESKLKRKRRKRKSSKQNDKQVNNDVLHANKDFVHFSDLDTFSSVRRPKQSSVIWKERRSSNTSNVDLSSVSHLKLNKNVKLYSRKGLSCNNSHLGETSSAYVCNDAMDVSCNSRLCDSFDKNNLFVFDDESVRISPVSKMPYRKKPRVSMNVRSKSNSNKSLPRTVHEWLPKMQLLAEPVAKWISRIVQICLWIIDSRCSKHMTGNRALLINFVKKFLGTARFGNNDFAMIAGYGDVVIGSMTIKKVYYVEGLGRNLFSVGQFCDKGLENATTKWCREREESNLSEAARTMLTFANLLLFLWAEAIATACFTQNRLIIHKRFDKTPYELMNKRKPNIKFFCVFGCRCYLLNDYEDVGKLKANGDIGVFVGYSKEYAAFRIYNKRTHKIHESVNVNFDEISEMASKQFSLEPDLSNLNETEKSSNLLVSRVSETSKKVLEVPSHEEVFHESFESFKEESSSSSLNDDVQQSSEEVRVPSSNTQSISNMIPNVDEATLRDADWVSAMQEEL